jgi:SAM-dependent methyltransferase
VAVGLSVDVAAQRGARVEFLAMDAEAMTFADRSFDAVVGSGILHHLDLDVAVREVARVLRPGGRAVFYEPLGHNPLINAFRHLTPALRTEDEHPLLMSDLRHLGTKFGTVSVRYHVLTALLAVPLIGLGRIGREVARLLDRADRILFRLVPAVRRYAWIVILELSDPRDAPVPALADDKP